MTAVRFEEITRFHASTLRALDTRIASRTRRLVEGALATVETRAARRGLSSYQRFLAEGGAASLREVLDGLAGDLDDEIRSGQRAAGRLAHESLVRNLRRARPKFDPSRLRPITTVDLVTGLGRLRTDLIKGLKDDARERIRSAIIRGTLIGESPTKIERAAVQELTNAEAARARRREGEAATSAARAAAIGEEIASAGVSGRILARAEAIARTEGLTAFSVAWQIGAEEAAAEIPGLKKTWDAIDDDRVREDHMKAEIVSTAKPITIDARFVVGKARLLMPRDPSGVAIGPEPAKELAKQRIQCRCASQLR